MAKKDNEEIPFAASPSAGNSEKLVFSTLA